MEKHTHTCHMTPPRVTRHSPVATPLQRRGRAAKEEATQKTVRDLRMTGGVCLPPDATEKGRPLRLSWCSDHTHIWSTPMTTTRPGEAGDAGELPVSESELFSSTDCGSS